jgi:head-tail adaptor
MAHYFFEQMKSRVVLQSPITKPDKYGGFEVFGWQDVLYAWAKREQIQQVKPQVRVRDFSMKFYSFIIRANPEVHSCTRILCPLENRSFYIETINQIEGALQYLEVIAYEKVKFERRT